jgi:hypothetical protein
MGRKKKYNTAEEQREAQNRWAREYYERNKELIDKKAKEKYYELRENLQSDNRESKIGESKEV